MEELLIKLDYAISLVEELEFSFEIGINNTESEYAIKMATFLTSLPEKF